MKQIFRHVLALKGNEVVSIPVDAWDDVRQIAEGSGGSLNVHLTDCHAGCPFVGCVHILLELSFKDMRSGGKALHRIDRRIDWIVEKYTFDPLAK